MAGTNADFPSDDFRNNIRFVWDMAAAPIADERVTFHFASQLVYNITDADEIDDSGLPFDPESTVTPTTPDPVQVPCAAEYVDAQGAPLRPGDVSSSHIKVTVLDEEYVKVREAAYIVVAGDRYDYDRAIPPSGLFDVGLYELVFTARGET